MVHVRLVLKIEVNENTFHPKVGNNRGMLFLTAILSVPEGEKVGKCIQNTPK